MVDSLINFRNASLISRDGALLTTSEEALSGGLLAGMNALTTSAEPLASTAEVKEVLVQADPANSANVLVGNATGQYITLEAGDSISLPVNDVALIYVKAATGTPTVNWIART